jgi:hypothetical protein
MKIRTNVRAGAVSGSPRCGATTRCGGSSRCSGTQDYILA